jgi:ferredoxin
VDQKVHINCSSQARGPEAKAACGSQHSCIGCGICAKKCPEEAITVANFLAHIDAEKCTNCGACAEACPTKAILDVLAGSR